MQFNCKSKHNFRRWIKYFRWFITNITEWHILAPVVKRHNKNTVPPPQKKVEGSARTCTTGQRLFPAWNTQTDKSSPVEWFPETYSEHKKNYLLADTLWAIIANAYFLMCSERASAFSPPSNVSILFKRENAKALIEIKCRGEPAGGRLREPGGVSGER